MFNLFSSSCDNDDKNDKTKENATGTSSKLTIYASICGVCIIMIIGSFFTEGWVSAGLLIFGVIGILIFAYPTYQYYLQYQKLASASANLWDYPGKDAMLGEGQCPDGWVAQFDGQQVKCVNVNQIPLDGGDTCLDKGETNTKTFKTMKIWPPKGNDIKERCEWTEKCGVSPHIPASWSGLGCNLISD